MPTNQTRSTLATLRTSIQQRGAFATGDTVLTTTVLNALINAALKQVSGEHDWPWLLSSATITTVAGTATYNVAATYLSTRTITETSTDVVLRSKNLRDILEMSDATTGRPMYYVVEEEQILLRPIPDGVYTLTHYFYKMEPLLSVDGTSPLIPAAYEEGVIEYVLFLAHRVKGDKVRADLASEAYRRWLARLSDNLSESREPRPPRVTRAW